MRTFETGGPLNVSVDCPEGDVRVTTTDDPRAEVDVQPLRDDDASREAAAGTTVELRGTDLVVEVPKRSWGLFARGPRIRIDVRVPHGSGLSFKTASADVHATGRYGDVRGKTASGDVVVSEAGSVRVESASGDLRVDEVRGDAGLKSVSGDVQVGHAGGALDASVVSGDLRVSAADGDASLQAVSGDIDLAAIARGGVEVRSVSGDVTVGVRQGSRVHIDVTTVTGDLKSDLDLGDSPAPGDGPMVEITGRTVSGDLRVRRAG